VPTIAVERSGENAMHAALWRILNVAHDWAARPLASADLKSSTNFASVVEKRARRICADTSGASAVEFAIVVSLFLALSLGVLAYGIYLGAAHGVSQLAADAARASVAGLTDTERTNLAKAHVTKNAGDFLLLTANKVAVETTNGGDVNQFKVILRYDAADLPIWFMSSLVPLPAKTIVRSASIKRGGY
jgi:Flp pilus assembly protein TadG